MGSSVNVKYVNFYECLNKKVGSTLQEVDGSDPPKGTLGIQHLNEYLAPDRPGEIR